MTKPVLWIAGGGPGVPVVYGYGYWTGPEGVLCIRPDIPSAEIAETELSPLSRWKLLAWIKFRLKAYTRRKQK